MKISEIITDKYKLRIPPTVYYDLLADVVEAEENQEPCDAISREEVIREIKEWIATESKMAMGERFLLDRIKNIPNIEPKTKNIVNHGTMNITL